MRWTHSWRLHFTHRCLYTQSPNRDIERGYGVGMPSRDQGARVPLAPIHRPFTGAQPDVTPIRELFRFAVVGTVGFATEAAVVFALIGWVSWRAERRVGLADPYAGPSPRSDRA